MKNVVIEELENFRDRTEKRFLIMEKIPCGLNPCFPGVTFELLDAKNVCNALQWNVEKIGTFWEIVD